MLYTQQKTIFPLEPFWSRLDSVGSVMIKRNLTKKACTVCSTSFDYSDFILGRKELLNEVNMEEDE